MPPWDPSDDVLRERLRAKGWTPPRAALAPLLGRLAGDEAGAELAERALERLGEEAARAAMTALPDAAPPARGRLCRLVGRIAQARRAEPLVRFLLERVDDADPKTRRNAIIALGKLGGEEVEARLCAAYAGSSIEHQRSIAAALGKLGGKEALALLRAAHAGDAELRRIVQEAVLKLERTLGRRSSGRIDATRAAPGPLPVVVRCREGLEPFVLDELGAEASSHEAGPGRVTATLTGPLGALYRSRVMLRFGFPLDAGGTRDPGEALVRALTSQASARIFAAFTDGPVRYRIEWASGGHRRGLTFRAAEAIARARPELVNDPTESLWEAVVTEPPGAPVEVELWPRGLPDERFAYRRAHVPASSHPTVAAALVRLGGARADDVVWDPFTGAGTELVERARLGPYARLLGTDLDAQALDRARENLAAAGIAAELAVADARTHAPRPAPTLVVTNPPMGRRVLDKRRTSALVAAFLENAARRLRPGGRLVWITPRARDAVRLAGPLGLEVTFQRRVDMGGFWAELQAMVKRR